MKLKLNLSEFKIEIGNIVLYWYVLHRKDCRHESVRVLRVCCMVCCMLYVVVCGCMLYVGCCWYVGRSLKHQQKWFIIPSGLSGFWLVLLADYYNYRGFWWLRVALLRIVYRNSKIITTFTTSIPSYLRSCNLHQPNQIPCF